MTLEQLVQQWRQTRFGLTQGESNVYLRCAEQLAAWLLANRRGDGSCCITEGCPLHAATEETRKV